jgi:hypothetical protein
MAAVAEEKTAKKLEKSPFIGLIIDESTDISTEKKLSIFAKVVNLDYGEAETIYVKDVDVDNGQSDHLHVKLVDVMENDFNISMSKVFAFGSDGAAAMIGSQNSVSSKLKSNNALLINCHCAGHKCALCVSQAADKVARIKAYRDSLCSVYSYYASSSIRQKKMLDFQELFEGSKVPVKLKQLHRVRWLSMSECVEAMYRAWDGVCLSLNDDGAQNGSGPKGQSSAVARGLYKQVACTKYLLLTAGICDILAVITQLSKTFQMADIDLSLIEPAVQLALSKLEQFKTESGSKLATVLAVLADCKTEYRKVQLKDNNEETKNDILNVLQNFVNEICKNLKSRFPQEETCVLSALDKILNPKRLPIRAADLKSYGEQHLAIVTKHFCQKPHHSADSIFVSPDQIISEWHDCSLQMHANRSIGLADFCKQLITTPHYTTQYPNLIKLANLALIVPVTSVECERGFSCQNRIKTKFRARLKNPTLDRLMRLAFSKDIFLNNDDYLIALQKWKDKKDRRLI